MNKRGVVLEAGLTPNRIGVRQGGGLTDDPNGRYLFAVSGCCDAGIVSVMDGGKCVAQQCSDCHAELSIPLGPTLIDLHREDDARNFRVFVYEWTGYKPGDLEMEYEFA